MFRKIKLVVLGFIALVFVTSVLTQDWQMFKDGFALLAFVFFVYFMKALFVRDRLPAGTSCYKCGGSGRISMPGHITNGLPCSH